ncbi:hypothetical protein ATANTOWER_003484 [Ataeniobius toweri]|uniref:Uncharacterized protein n=1 Tax=Ataeniobius toweri TaxID=208326 RepID=A0ABU7BGS0_9TELE|nr:hypothetical protein [Ataeniobius toweri]
MVDLSIVGVHGAVGVNYSADSSGEGFNLHVLKAGLQDGTFCSTVALQQEGPEFKSQPIGSFCREFACIPHACVGSLRVLQIPSTVQKHDWLIGQSKLPLCKSVWCLSCVSLCLPCDGLVTCPGGTPPLAQ